MELIYVAGKYRGKSVYEITENIELARKHSASLWKQGFAVICPHMNTSLFDGLMPDETFLEGTMEMLKRCDTIYMLPNWEQSKGALIELEYAIEHGLKVMYGKY